MWQVKPPTVWSPTENILLILSCFKLLAFLPYFLSPSFHSQPLECLAQVAQYKAGNFPKNFGVYAYSGFEEMNLFRVQNNELFIDWPWGRERIREYLEAKPPNNGSTPFRIDRRKMHNYWLMQNTLRMVTVNDSIFMMGGEQPVLPWLLPFPSFMFAPKLGHSEMPFPWPQSFRDELAIYRRAMNEHDELIKSHPETYNNHHHLNYSDEFYMKQAQQKPWNEKIPKAAFYSTYDFLRRVVWDQAALRPGDPPVVALAINPHPHIH